MEMNLSILKEITKLLLQHQIKKIKLFIPVLCLVKNTFLFDRFPWFPLKQRSAIMLLKGIRVMELEAMNSFNVKSSLDWV